MIVVLFLIFILRVDLVCGMNDNSYDSESINEDPLDLNDFRKQEPNDVDKNELNINDTLNVFQRFKNIQLERYIQKDTQWIITEIDNDRKTVFVKEEIADKEISSNPIVQITFDQCKKYVRKQYIIDEILAEDERGSSVKIKWFGYPIDHTWYVLTSEMKELDVYQEFQRNKTSKRKKQAYYLEDKNYLSEEEEEIKYKKNKVSQSKRKAKYPQSLNDFNNPFKMDICAQKILDDDQPDEKQKNASEKDSSRTSEEYNELKRKHKPEKICEFCQRDSTNYRKGKFSGKSLCDACYTYEFRHGHLLPLDERKRYTKHRDYILGCEFCQRESITYKTGKVSGKSLCHPCYHYESQHGYLLPLDERKKGPKQKHHILVCEFCQKESIKYTTGKVSGKSLCQPCYKYESLHGHLLPLDERINYTKHKDHIIVCEFCQKDSAKYTKGIVSGKSLCQACYDHERRHGKLIPLHERKKISSHKYHILVCEFCQKDSKNYRKGKVCGKYLCQACYKYEFRHGHLLPLDERKGNAQRNGNTERKEYTKHENDILACEFCRKEYTRCIKSKVSGKSLCQSCYFYEYRHGHLEPLDERKKILSHKYHLENTEENYNAMVKLIPDDDGGVRVQLIYEVEDFNDRVENILEGPKKSNNQSNRLIDEEKLSDESERKSNMDKNYVTKTK